MRQIDESYLPPLNLNVGRLVIISTGLKDEAGIMLDFSFHQYEKAMLVRL